MYDIIVAGAGPAGLTAAIYARRSGRSVLLLEKEGFGGQMAVSPRVENYPGFSSIAGAELAERMLEQCTALGAEIGLCEVLGAEDGGAVKRVKTDDGVFQCRALILATGVRHRRLGLAGEEELTGAGVSFCAVCDGDFYRGKNVAVIGGGDSALQEALFLSRGCASVTVCHRRDFTAEPALQERLFEQPNIAAMNFVRPTAFLQNADGGLRGLRLAWTESGEEFELPCDGVFEAVGLLPANEAFAPLAELDGAGYFRAGEDGLTATPGVFVAGDCRAKGLRQIATAVADGAAAATAAVRWLDGAQ